MGGQGWQRAPDLGRAWWVELAGSAGVPRADRACTGWRMKARLYEHFNLKRNVSFSIAVSIIFILALGRHIFQLGSRWVHIGGIQEVHKWYAGCRYGLDEGLMICL